MAPRYHRAVVNAAGRGTRLGLEVPKALAGVAGRPLIEWQLQLLEQVEDVVVVVGHCADQLAEVVRRQRPDAGIVRNPDFASTGTAASLLLGAQGAPGLVTSVDCDLIVHPDDLMRFLGSTDVVVGVTPRVSEEPVGVVLDTRQWVLGFKRGNDADAEWSGLVTFDPSDARLGPRRGHVYELITPLLPIRALPIRARELDYPSELPAMEEFVQSLLEQGRLR